MTRPNCPARKLLLLGKRPPSQTKQIAAGLCSTECIFCDIWQLATLVQSHTPRPKSPTGSRTPSPTSDIERSIRSLEQQFQSERIRLSSILSICVVEGAEESMGLRLAHDRCLNTVTSILEQIANLEVVESPVSPLTPVQSRSSQRSLRRESGVCGLRDSYFGGGISNNMGMAM